MYKIIIFCVLALFNSLAYSDLPFKLIQITQPEKEFIVEFFNLFSLSKNEVKAINNLANKDTLYTYGYLAHKKNLFKKHFGKVDITIATTMKGQSENREAAVIINVNLQGKKIINDLYIYLLNYSAFKIMNCNEKIIFQTSNGNLIDNYEINFNSDSIITNIDQLKMHKIE